jgi:ADP-ribose pyrophosphatase YjhB (NUDIX family)
MQPAGTLRTRSADIYPKREGGFMYEKGSHCSFCGARFGGATAWPRTCRACGNRSYLNPIPVAVVVVPVADGIVVVRRNIEPRKGTLTLPGGYIDLGETWQEAGAREVREETGIAIDSGELGLYDVMNGFDATLVVFGLAAPRPRSVLRPFSSAETQEVVLIDRPVELGFPMHTQVVVRYFAERGRLIGGDEVSDS